MNNKQVLVYSVLEPTNDLRGTYVEHIHFKKLTKFQNFFEIFHFYLTKLRNKKQGLFWSYLLIRTNLKKKMGQFNLKKPFEFYNSRELFYCGITTLRNTKLGVFRQCQYTRTILRSKNMEQSPFKKQSKFRKFRWNVLLCHNQTQEHEFECSHTISTCKNNFKKRKYGRESV